METVHQARPGLTGFWQVSGENRIPFEERVKIEAWYVRNWSVWLDVVIALRTVRVVLTQEEAY
ncbi:MAG: sugar transferase [Salinibacter sp.]